VAFDIDSNGILNVSAKDKATGKEQSIVIKASSGLSEEEVEAMVNDAESHADEDRKAREMVDARNTADNMIHATKKSLDELGDKVDESEKSSIESAISDLEEVMKGEDKDAIESKTQVLTELSGKLAEKLYSQADAEGGATATDANAQASNNDDVVDAEFEEVDEDKKAG